MAPSLHESRYPIGPPKPVAELTPADREARIRVIEELPGGLRAAVQGLDDAQLDTPYRSGGWSIRQVVHHLPDSHMNAYVRFKLAVTEEHPTIRPYDESAWASQWDARQGPVETSLVLLEALHGRWVAWLRHLGEEVWVRTLRHPEDGDMNLNELLCIYAWHSEHHLAHVTGLRRRAGW